VNSRWTVHCPHRCKLGEGPLWSDREHAVYWVDILAPAVHRLSLTGHSITSWAMPEPIGWLVERQNQPGFIAGFQSGFAKLTLKPLSVEHIVDPEPGLPGNRMNDCAVDGAGRLWAGTMDAAIQAETGALYRLDPDLSLSKHDEGYRVTNGPAFSRDGATLYHNDTAKRLVYAFPLHADGSLGERRVFIRFRDEWGHPDGMTVDAEDGLWIAHWGGGRVSRFTPQGELDRSITLPASQITSCVFAGTNLDRLFITSAADKRDDEPHAGKLFEVEPRVRGVPQPRFAG
jgi:xylono-1,5-lactonase